MNYVLKYSGEDRDYFLSPKTHLKPFEFVVHEFHCDSESDLKQNIHETFKSFVKRGLIYNDSNISHLRTVNRDVFRMFIMKEYNVDMINVERRMNELYMKTYISSSSDDEVVGPDVNCLRVSSSSSSSDEEGEGCGGGRSKRYDNDEEEDYDDDDDDEEGEYISEED